MVCDVGYCLRMLRHKIENTRIADLWLRVSSPRNDGLYPRTIVSNSHCFGYFGGPGTVDDVDAT